MPRLEIQTQLRQEFSPVGQPKWVQRMEQTGFASSLRRRHRQIVFHRFFVDLWYARRPGFNKEVVHREDLP